MRWSSGLDAAALSARLDDPLPEREAQRFEQAAALRATRIPLSHVTGERLFWGRIFTVTPDVLDPRPETEILVAWALEQTGVRRVLDLGVGSGCILLSILTEWPDATGVGVDASPAALAVAERNARALGVADRAELCLGDWLDGVTGRFDLILANPPYLAAAEMAKLLPEVRAEPTCALEAGPDGLDAYRRIAANAAKALAPGGVLLVEIGPTQADPVSRVMEAGGLSRIGERRDFDDRVRCVGFSPRIQAQSPAFEDESAR
jgi:release factor glutamine methyltransferase